MSKTYVEKFLEDVKSERQTFRNTVVDRIMFIQKTWAGDPEDNDHNVLARMQRASKMVESLTKEMKMHDAVVGQYELLNDIRLGKVKLVDADTNKLVKVHFGTFED